MSETAALPEYRVLARKYRPTNFEDVIGQGALVRTLTNAIAAGRLAHAFILNGVRGIGKTTTARIIARALNCSSSDGPTISPCGTCENCQAILADRHVDVLEMDAASNTGVDNIREIIDNARYKPSLARYKVYIIDEVHMLSKSAFNALLKTLEEPPAHVKFIFATTEIRKVPITVLSRCQRFDLRRVDAPLLTSHFTSIAEKEGWKMDEAAAKLIATAADGSVRDGLSILDQAGALSPDGAIDAELVSGMLGLANQSQVEKLFEALCHGHGEQALDIFADLYVHGADPILVLQDLATACHQQSKHALRTDKSRIPQLSRFWQILLKGLGEVTQASQPQIATEMVLIRLAHAAALPTPAEVITALKSLPPEGGSGGATSSSSAPAAANTSYTSAPTAPVASSSINSGPTASAGLALQPQTAPQMAPEAIATTQPQSFVEVVNLFSEKREAILYTHLREDAHLISFKPGHIELRLTPLAPQNLAGRVGQLLKDWTGERWVVSLAQSGGEPTLAEQAAAQQEALIQQATEHPLVSAVITAFPGAKVTKVEEDPAA